MSSKMQETEFLAGVPEGQRPSVPWPVLQPPGRMSFSRTTWLHFSQSAA